MKELIAQVPDWSSSEFKPAQLVDFEVIFGNITQVVLGLSAVALFVMFVLGGIKFITAGSDPKAAEAAKKTLTYAVYGVVVLALAYLILRLIANFTGIEGLVNFDVYLDN